MPEREAYLIPNVDQHLCDDNIAKRVKTPKETVVISHRIN